MRAPSGETTVVTGGRRTCYILLNLAAIFLFLLTAALLLLWPEHLKLFKLTVQTAQVLLMAEISLLLMLSIFQRTFSKPIRWALGVGSVVVLAEAAIMTFWV